MGAPIKRFIEMVPGGQWLADATLLSLHHGLPAVLPRQSGPAAGSLPSSAVSGRHDGPSARPRSRPDNPLLRGTDVTDYGDADFVADPFLYVADREEWHLFFEVFNGDRTPDSAIGHATSTDRGRTWQYDRIVLNTGFHVSFPYVFEWNDTRYLLPEQKRSDGTHALVLYEATAFPTDWRPVETLIAPDHAVDDAVVFRWNGRWWLIAGDQHGAAGLHVYHSDDLRSRRWTAHPDNPVVSDRLRAVRPGGRPVVRDDDVVMLYQDCRGRYGERLRAYRITELSRAAYSDTELATSPVLEPSRRRFGWNTGAMHHLDLHREGGRQYCVVDGNVGFGHGLLSASAWSIGGFSTDPGLES
jgi:hypothetical protein